MTWHPNLAEQSPLLVGRLGFRKGELRLYFQPAASAKTHYVIQLEEVAAFYDTLPRGQEVRISDRPEHGSFGWWLPADDPHHSVQVTAAAGGGGFFLALARRVVYRIAGLAEASNWPG